MRAVSPFVLALLAPVTLAPAQASVMLTDTTYAQGFDSLASSGFSSVLPTGWSLAETGNNANDSYRAANGANNAGDTYSFGATGSNERALGGIGSNNLVTSFGVQFINALGSSITSLEISYFGELWRAGTADNLNRLGFAYALDASSLTTGTYVGFAALDYAIAPGGPSNTARDGNANRTFIKASIGGLDIMPGGSIFLRWQGENAAGADHGLAIDDFALTATTLAVIPEPSSWAMLIAGFGVVGAMSRRRRARAVMPVTR